MGNGATGHDASGSDENEGLERRWLTGLVGYHLRMAHLALYRDFAANMTEFDLTQKQLAALELIATNPGASQVDIANALSMDRATMMGMVKRLMARGFIERRSSAVDRRRHEMRLSTSGQEVLGRVHGIIDRHEKDFCSVLSEDERRDLIRMLRRLYERPPT
ncbi:MarR family winged helix-turn-helix transcriptional regulator [Affinirhizobium pseudoryzae]|uniref:MarR family winged helix-turn-helix transcriptional regulator n=1 Tax=Allorhizobium pseudoryzae TaxID=379684 RepID=UPI0013EC22C5|nr:MarR family winged helix-turn-helix transcriptional regulator [Allorhizobium pseudoryzae]